jgi:FkbM family methyltransferase
MNQGRIRMPRLSGSERTHGEFRRTRRKREIILKTLKYALTSAVIRLGPRNALVLFLIDRKCRQFGATLTNRGSFLSLRKGNREMLLAPKHFVYAPDMAERFDIYFSPLVPTQASSISMLDFSHPGILQTYASSGLQFQMASFPEEDEAIESYFHWYTPKAGETVFDVGAHCGVSTYHLSKLVGPTGRVIAFEPDPVNYSLLLLNIERHQLSNVTPLQIAISDTRGEAEFNCEGTIGSGLKQHSTRKSADHVITVKTVTLEDACSEWGPPSFCKIDIEGAEVAVLSAAKNFLQTTSCQFALDTNHLVNGLFTDQRIEKLFQECGYEATSSTSGMKTTWARSADFALQDTGSTRDMHLDYATASYARTAVTR